MKAFTPTTRPFAAPRGGDQPADLSWTIRAPTDFHLHLAAGAVFQLVLVTSGMFHVSDYGRTLLQCGAPGAVMAAKRDRFIASCFYTWSRNGDRREPEGRRQTVVPGRNVPMGYSGKFLEAFVTDPTTFSEPDHRGAGSDQRGRKRRVSPGRMPMHDRPADAGFLATGIRWRWMLCSSRSQDNQIAIDHACFTCAISASKCRAVIL